MGGRLRLVIALTAVVLAACSPAGILPTRSGVEPAHPPGVLVACSGTGFSDLVIRARPGAAELVVVEIAPGQPNAGKILHARWPHGFTARFAPGLEIVDDKGAVVLHDGDRMSRVGVGGSGEPLDIYEFDGRSYSCF